MLLNCGVGEDSWESLGLQDQTNQSWRKSVLNIHWKDWCWSWSSNTLANLMQRTDSLEETLMLGKIEGGRRRGCQRMRWLDGITDSIVWVSSGMGREAWYAAVHGVTKSQTRLSNWTEVNWLRLTKYPGKYKMALKIHYNWMPPLLFYIFKFYLDKHNTTLLSDQHKTGRKSN